MVLVTEIKCQKKKKTIPYVPEYRQNLLFNPQSPRRPGDELSLSYKKKWPKNFTLFGIEEEIAVHMPKSIARRAKIQLDE